MDMPSETYLECESSVEQSASEQFSTIFFKCSEERDGNCKITTFTRSLTIQDRTSED